MRGIPSAEIKLVGSYCKFALTKQLTFWATL